MKPASKSGMRRSTPTALLLSLIALLAGPLRAQPTATLTLDPETVTWSRLEYRASKLMMSGRSEIELIRPAPPMRFDLIPATRGEPLESRRGRPFLLELDHRFGSKESTDHLWFDPVSAAALLRVHLEAESRKAFRFTDTGVAYVKRKPEARRASPDPGDPFYWTVTFQHFYPHTAAGGDVPVVTEPAALLYLVSTGALSRKGDRMALRAFARREVQGVELEVVGPATVSVDFQETGAGQEPRKRQGRVQALKIAVRAAALPGTDDEDGFELLGLQKDIEIFVEETSRLPVLVTGRIPIFGRVEIQLDRVTLDGALP